MIEKYLKQTLAFGTAVIILFTSTSCGKITEYETKHDCGTYTIATFEDIEALAFEEHTPMKKVAKLFNNFCYYTGENSSDLAYVAYVPVDMSQFFESEVIVLTIDDGEGKEQSFPEFVKSEKENFEEKFGNLDRTYDDLGDGSEAELYIYFNADMELSAWKLCPEVKTGSADSMFWKTFQKKYKLLDVEHDTKTFSDEIGSKTYDLPYLVITLYFSCSNGIFSIYQDAVETKNGFTEKDYIFYVPKA